MKTISFNLAHALVRIGANVETHYWGRGRQEACFGIVLKRFTNLAKIALDLPSGVQEEFRAVLNNAHQDSFGGDCIVNFPAYQWPEDVQCRSYAEDEANY